MKRRIIHIDQEKCNGCGACANACHEGAIGMVEGKAKLLSDAYCDGLGDCLPACPAGAITFTEREALAYDEAAVAANRERRAGGTAGRENAGGTAPASRHAAPQAGGCPGRQIRTMTHRAAEVPAGNPPAADGPASALGQWPCQIRLVPADAPYFDGAELLIAADCTAYAYAAMHRDVMRGKITLIGCPKLDDADYREKLTAILSQNDIRSLTVARMEVPCCGGLEYAAREALRASGKRIPWLVLTVTVDGTLRD